MNKNTGFTLIELMMTLAVAAILAGFAAPSFTSIVMNNRMASQVNELVGVLAHARSEAVKRKNPVSVCKSADGSSCNGTNWEDGWIVFINNDNDTPAAVDSGEEIVRTHEALPDGSTLRGTSTMNYVTYQTDGFSNNGRFTLCDSRGAAKARVLFLSSTGRPRILANTRGRYPCP